MEFKPGQKWVRELEEFVVVKYANGVLEYWYNDRQLRSSIIITVEKVMEYGWILDESSNVQQILDRYEIK